MVYNSEANDQDIVSEVLAICTTDINTLSVNEITRRFNSYGLDEYYTIAFLYGQRRNFDDIDETSPPIDTQDIVSGTNRYKVSAFTATVLAILKLELLDADADVVNIEPDTFEAMKERGENFDDIYVNCSAGTPSKYIIYGDFIYFNAKPNWSEAKGLLVYFSRALAYLSYNDTTQIPPVPSIHHHKLCRMASLPWLIENNVASAPAIAIQVEKDKDDIAVYFSSRANDLENKLNPNVESCK